MRIYLRVYGKVGKQNIIITFLHIRYIARVVVAVSVWMLISDSLHVKELLVRFRMNLMKHSSLNLKVLFHIARNLMRFSRLQENILNILPVKTYISLLMTDCIRLTLTQSSLKRDMIGLI